MQRPIYGQVSEYLDYCSFTRGMSKMTLTSKRHTYKHFIIESGCDDLSKLTNAQFNDWTKAQIKSGVSPRTINTRSAHLLAMLRYFREMGMNYPIKLPLIKKMKEGPCRRKFYTKEQIGRVLKTADEMGSLMIRICFDAGLRITELTNLRLDNFSGRRINFIGKGFKPRESYISEETEKYLAEYVNKHDVEDWLWISERGCHMSVDMVRHHLAQPFHDAGFSDFYPHSLRHSFATDLQARGATVEEIQQMIGHNNVATTQRYMHGFEGQLGNLFDKYRQ